MDKKKDWLKQKKYVHIGNRINNKNIDSVRLYVKNSDRVAKHAFTPLIHYTKDVNKFRGKKHDRERGALKQRDIFYASHIDSAIMSYYTKLLTDPYEKELLANGLSSSVTAYREIKHANKDKGKCNIDYAKEVFDYISTYGECDVIAMDITGFFDNLDHSKIKHDWCRLLGTDRLPPDHYAIYKFLCRHTYVERTDIFNVFKDRINVFENGKTKYKRFDRIEYMRNSNCISFCKKKDVTLLARKGYLKPNKGREQLIGIPQGLPISAFLANLYMLTFDISTNKYVEGIGGLYRRYSDDIIIVCDKGHKNAVIKHICNAIETIGLEINSDKTQEYAFRYSDDTLSCFIQKDSTLTKSKLTYLGFDFNGINVRIKSGSISSYYSKFHNSLKCAAYHAKTINNSTNGEIFKSRLIKKYAYPILKNTKKGSYLSYVKRAAIINNDERIFKQMRNHFKIISKSISKRQLEVDAYLNYTKKRAK